MIVDSLGRPIQAGSLKQTQTAQIVRLQQTWAGHPVRGLTPSLMAGLLEAAEHGDLSAQADLFQDMEERDPHLHAEMAKRRRAILGLPWAIEPPPNPSAKEKRQAKAAAELLTALPDLEDTVLDLMDAVGHGFVCCEIQWRREAATGWLPERITHRPQSWFQLDTATRQELRLADGSAAGVELWPMGWIQHRHAARSGYLSRAGLYRVLAWPWIMRQFSLRDMAEWLEIYGLPMRLGFYPPGAEPNEKATLYRAVQDLGRHAAGILPDGMRIELEAAAEGQSDPFMAMVEYCDRAMSKAILGGTLSSTPGATGLGSGVAELQGEVRRDLLVSDARQVQGTLTRDLLWPIVALNGLGEDPRRAPRWVFDTSESEDLDSFSQSLERLVAAGMGAHIPVAWVQERAGIPAPAEGEATLAPAAPEPPTPTQALPLEGGGVGRGSEPAALSASAGGHPTPAGQALVDAEASRDPGWAAAMEGLLAPILQALEDGLDPEQILARLPEWYGAMDDRALIDLLDRGVAAAEAIGRLEVQAETNDD